MQVEGSKKDRESEEWKQIDVKNIYFQHKVVDLLQSKYRHKSIKAWC